MKKEFNTESRNWLSKDDKPIIIAGPCSAETEDQLIGTAKSMKESGGVNIIRAGIWKPRTRPNLFEGVGETGLNWLINAGKETGLPVATEVANAKHVEESLKAGIDILWIGARTTVNPFSVQEIADALKGVDVPVFVKNPVNPDLSLWIGALERMNNAGITKLGAIHRGFSSFNKSVYRNFPLWEFPIELKRLHPEIPIICDPSHISGNRDLISLISQKALDLEMDGLMIETHIHPDSAWSDKDQQVTPKELKRILDELVFRKRISNNKDFKNKLENLRSEIDHLDEEILQKIGARMKIAIEIGKYKRENEVTILQMDRWDQILQQRKRLGTAIGLNEGFIDEFLSIIHKESIDQQTKIMN